MNQTLGIALVCFLVGLTIAGWVQGLRLDAVKADHARYVAQVEANAALAEQARINTENRWKQEVENAKADAEKRLTALQADVQSSRAAAERLRDDAAALRERFADASATAAIESAATSASLLAECGARYRDMAEIADRHAADVRTLMAAWPG